jgi:hypothetical protein
MAFWVHFYNTFFILCSSGTFWKGGLGWVDNQGSKLRYVDFFSKWRWLEKYECRALLFFWMAAKYLGIKYELVEILLQLKKKKSKMWTQNV